MARLSSTSGWYMENITCLFVDVLSEAPVYVAWGQIGLSVLCLMECPSWTGQGWWSEIFPWHL